MRELLTGAVILGAVLGWGLALVAGSTWAWIGLGAAVFGLIAWEIGMIVWEPPDRDWS